MNRPVKILIMCGSSVATSSLAAVKIENEARRRRVKVIIHKGKIADADSLISTLHPDIVVSTTTSAFTTDLPVFNGLPLVMSQNEAVLFDQMFAAIDDLQS